jgi:SAM-dependent methyltransferase
MHDQAKNFTMFVKDILPSYFCNKKVLDVGSGDINGNNFFLFKDCEYHGNDVIKTKNVTIVSKTKDLPFLDDYFDTIISTECFEHDPEYEKSLDKIVKLLKPGGLFLFTCASTGRAEHGTRNTSPQDSYGTIGKLIEMQDYYKNLNISDIDKAVSLNDIFSVWNSYYNSESKDLYFLGIKKGVTTNFEISDYDEYLVEKTFI